jgi:hypothetical protein
VLRSRLVAAEDALAAGRPSITVGGKRLWRSRAHLDEAAMTEAQWRARWDAARVFLTADGESGKAGGNETIRVDEAGRLRIKVPAALAAQLGSHLDIAASVWFAHRGTEWADRVAGRRAVRYDITYDPARDRWYLDAWKQDPLAAPPSIEQLRTGPVLGVDLNADHLACCVLDGSGNPIGDPMRMPVDTAGLPASQRDGRVRAAITALLDAAAHAQCTAVVIENLNFADARAIGRDTMGRGARGKRFRRAVAGMHPHHQVPHPTHLDGGPPRHRSDRGGRGLHQQMGRSTLGETPTTADFRTGHPPSRRGDRDRQTWPRIND